MISKELINEIKASVNIVDIIGESVALTKTGRNYLGLCPFHGEKTPSFNVVEDKQFYHCFGCGKSGDVFKFIEEIQGISFTDSVQLIAEKAGIRLDIASKVKNTPKEHPHQVLYDIHKEATKFYHALLMTTKMGEAARTYLHQRGLTDETIQYFQLGLAPNQPAMLYQALSKKFSEEDLLRSGLFNTGDNNLIYDTFQERIIFPLSDEYGRVMAFSGRKWAPEMQANKQIAKYKNSRGTVIFNKSYELYHLDKAKSAIKKQREVYLMEGFMDVIASYRAGIENAVASMGTALTVEHVAHLRKHCRKVVLVYDGDKAGQAATAKALEELKDFTVEIVSLPDGMDPDEFINRHSEDALKQVLTKHRISDVEFLMQYLQPENLANLQMQIEFVDKMAPIIARTSSITAQHSYSSKLADLLPDFNYDQVEMTVNNARITQRSQITRQQKPRFQHVQELPTQTNISRLIRIEEHIFHRLLHYPYLLNEYRGKDFKFETPEIQVLYNLLKTSGEISSFELSQQPDAVGKAWYRILEANLPSELENQEMKKLEKTRKDELLKIENQKLSHRIREQAHIGNAPEAIDDLNQLIAQKRKMEE